MTKLDDMVARFKTSNETEADILGSAIAIKTDDVSKNDLTIWEVVSTCYADETLVLAAGTEQWPMYKEMAELIASALNKQYGPSENG